MKHILLFGAGKSAAFLINYLKELTTNFHYTATIADENLENARLKVGEHPFVQAAGADAEDKLQRQNLIKKADIVISLLPPKLHYLVAVDCITFSKHLLTASYLDERLLALKPQIDAAKLLFLCEMGLDPGIDHMSAVQLIHKIEAQGAKITSFKSHCGGLVSPESDDNPWHYKVSWNPANIISAGKAGAVFKENGETKRLEYKELFSYGKRVDVNENMMFSCYPNRDSLSYIPVYQLEDAHTFIRTTLRHPDFCFGWKNLIDLKLTDDTIMYDTTDLSIADFFKDHFDRLRFNDWFNKIQTARVIYAKDISSTLMQLMEAEKISEKAGAKENDNIMLVDESGELNTLDAENRKPQAQASLASKMHESNLILKQLLFLGLDSDEKINKGNCSAAEVLQFIIEKKLALQNNDQDMVVMVHEIEYEINKVKKSIKSSLIVKGKDSVNTAMAKTVGLPLGIAAKLILDGSLTLSGLHIPVHPAVYNPVLNELKKYEIVFEEKEK